MHTKLTAEGIGAYLLHVGQHIVQLERERDEARALLDKAFDVIPDGYTVLKGQILVALGYPVPEDIAADLRTAHGK